MEISVKGFLYKRRTAKDGNLYIEDYQKSLINQEEFMLEGKAFLLLINDTIINLSENISNCGIMNISQFGYNRWTLKDIKTLTEEIKKLIVVCDLDRNFLMGTINEIQKKAFGSQFEKCSWSISYLFKNDNSSQNCYLITKKLFE